MNRVVVAIIAVIVIIAALIGYILFFTYQSMMSTTTPMTTITPTTTTTTTTGRKNYTLIIMTTWPRWTQDDFKVYFFYFSGVGLGGVFVRPTASDMTGITNITFIYETDVGKWRQASMDGSVDGFIGLNRYNITYLCNSNALLPIDDPQILELAKQWPQVFKGYTSDGKLCWISPSFGASFLLLINTDFAKKYGLDIPSSFEDFLKPEVAKPLLDGRYILALPPLTAPHLQTAIHTILQKYGWNDGWVIITAMSSMSKVYTSSRKARDDIAILGNSLATILDQSTAISALSLGGNLAIVAPKNATAIYITPVAIAINTRNKDGMYSLIKWLMTNAQDELFLNRTGWMDFPVAPKANKHPWLVYREPIAKNAFPIDEGLVAEIEPAVTIYANVTLTDPDVKSLLTNIVKKLVEKYSTGRIDGSTYVNYLKLLGKPVSFINPVDGKRIEFTLDVAKQLSNAIRENSSLQNEVYKEFKNAILERLNTILSQLSS